MSAVRWIRCSGLGLLVAAGAACGRSEPPLSPIELASAATDRGATPMLAVTADGDRVLSWVADDPASGREALFVQVTPAGTAAPEPFVVVRDSLGGIEPHGEAPPRVVAAPDGAIYALYTVGREVPGQRFPRSALRFTRSLDGGRTWSEPVSVNEGERFGSHNFHALLGAAGGRVYAAWLSAGREGSSVWLRSSADGGRTWDSARSIDLGEACPCCRTGLALGPEGNLYVSWRKVFPGDVRDVVVMRSVDGGRTWDAPVRPREDGWVFAGCPHAGPSLEVDADGAVHIGWWTGKEGEAGVYYARSIDGGQSFTAVPLATGARAAPAHVQLATGPFGVIVAWDDGLTGTPRILMRGARSGTAFGPEWVVSGEGAASFPVLAVDGDSVTIAWSEKGREAHRADEAARPDMSQPGASMPLPRVGQSEIFVRRAKVAEVVGGY